MILNPEDPRLQPTGGTVCVFDDAGRLIGAIRKPIAPDPIGPGREKVYLDRSVLPANSAAA
jgi:hypothetical protein